MSRTRPNDGIRPWDRLRTRMAVSYVAVTLLIVLLVESLVVAVIYLVVTRSPMAGYWAMQRAGHVAQVYALQAAVQAEDSKLDPNTTFEPGKVNSLSLRGEDDTPQLSWFNLDVPYVEPGSSPADMPSVALLVGPTEQVLASSYPDRFPVAMSASDLLPEEIELIRNALAGKSDGIVTENTQSRYASVVQPILNQDREPLGAVIIRTPAGGPPDKSLIAELSSVLIPSAVLGLCLMTPIGMVFGVLATRSLVRRVERLAGATARFKEGDTSQRVPVNRADEIGQLERQFNQMAEQIVDSFAQRQALAEQSARAEERARIEQEMSSARYIQQSLLPEQLPSIPGWHIKTFYNPALEVGGDLYDFLALPRGRIGIVIGDASGKGVPSALIMATACAMLRAAAPGLATPGEDLALVNNLLHERIPPGTFATCFYAVLDPASGRLCFANAGHNIPYLCRDGEIRELCETGMPLGLMPDQDYRQQEMTLTVGDSLLFYTDGLVEAHGPGRSMFGSPRLKRLLQEHSSADGFIEKLVKDLKDFTGPAWDQEDDITLILLRNTG